MATSNLGWDNKFVTTLSNGITAIDTTIPLTNLPNASEGFLVIEPDSTTAWEEIYYTSKTGSAVVCPSVGAGRGQGNSSAASHSVGATVRMDSTAEMFEALQDGTGLAVNAITGEKLAASTIFLGYSEATSDQGSITTVTDLTNLSVTVTVPSGGRRVKITGLVRAGNGTPDQINNVYIFEGATQLGADSGLSRSGGASYTHHPMWVSSTPPSAGSHTYKLRADTGGGTMTTKASANAVAFILVELI